MFFKRIALPSAISVLFAVMAPMALARNQHRHHHAACIPSSAHDFRHTCRFNGATNQAMGMTLSTFNNARGGSPAVISFFGVNYATTCPDGTKSFAVQVSLPILVPLAKSGSFSYSGTYLSFSGQIHGTHASGKFAVTGTADSAGSCSNTSGTFTATKAH